MKKQTSAEAGSIVAPEATGVTPGTPAPHAVAVDPDNKGMRIGILIVAYNALTTLSKVLKRIPAAVWENIEEVAVFDDASPDETYELAVGYQTLFPNNKLTIRKNTQNLGYGGNQKCGYQYFMDKGFDVVIMLHGDGQYAPEILAQMYAPIVSGRADAVFGSRMMRDYGGPLKGGMPYYKYFGNKILTFLANRSLGMKLTEFHSGYRAYSLHALRRIDLSRMTNDFHFDTEIIIKLQHQGFQILEVPIPTYYGNEICYVNGMKYAKNVIRAIGRYKRTLRGVKIHPEFGEYHMHYPLKESKYSSHDHCRRECGSGNEVLDVGCGEGFFARSIQENDNRVVGIDALAQPRCADAFEQYISADLDHGLSEALPALGDRKFDIVLLQDVLEHVRCPEQLLEQCHSWLKPRGRLVVTVPNVANITVRLALLFGRFEYAPRGILDNTHLRFYTRKSVRRLLTDHGYEIEKQKMTVMPVELARGVSPRRWWMRALNYLLAGITWLFPGLFGYQVLLVGRSQAKAAQPAPPGIPNSARAA
jgi:2-polyprenyl-3-methyl-5-hydroxy-6-metoxy-1,4-benzoquinol methylase